MPLALEAGSLNHLNTRDILQLPLYASVWASVPPSVKWDAGLSSPHRMPGRWKDTVHVKMFKKWKLLSRV